jgi:hypothetical protein
MIARDYSDVSTTSGPRGGDLGLLFSTHANRIGDQNHTSESNCYPDASGRRSFQAWGNFKS